MTTTCHHCGGDLTGKLTYAVSTKRDGSRRIVLATRRSRVVFHRACAMEHREALSRRDRR